MLVVELLEHVGLELLVVPDRLQDLLALIVRGGLDEIGDLRRMKPREATRSEPQPRGRDVPDERLDLRPRHELGVLMLVAAKAPRQQPPDPGADARDRSPPRARSRRRSLSSTSRALTSRAVLTLIMLRPSTSARSSTSPGRRSNCARFSFVVEVRAACGSSRSIRSAGTNSSRPPIRAFNPVTGGS